MAHNVSTKRNRNIWLWIIGWLCFFPIPLTILLIRSKKMNKVVKYVLIAIMWLFILMIGIAGNSVTQTETINISRNSTGIDTNTKNQQIVKSISFNKTDDITVKVGQTFSSPYTHYLKVNMSFGEKLTPDTVHLISENPEIATIDVSELSSYRIKYSITGISAGETIVYAISNDGTVMSEKIRVIVPQPILAASLRVEYGKTDLAVGETIKPKVEILPTNAEDKMISWSSSNESVVTVDEKGVVMATGDGTSTVTATTSNGLSEFFEFAVDGSKHLMNLRTRYTRKDDNNIGSEWSHRFEINNENTSPNIAVSVGEQLNCWAQFTEADDNPDIGETSTYYVVSENDIINGFTITMNLSVMENAGKNAGKTADFEISFAFIPYSQ